MPIGSCMTWDPAGPEANLGVGVPGEFDRRVELADVGIIDSLGADQDDVHVGVAVGALEAERGRRSISRLCPRGRKFIACSAHPLYQAIPKWSIVGCFSFFEVANAGSR